MDSESNYGSLFCNGIELSGLSEIHIDTSSVADESLITYTLGSISLNTDLNEDNIRELLRTNYGTDCKWQIQIPITEQIRKHKKKRINKKWLKRYGTKTKYIQKDCTLDNIEIPRRQKSNDWCSQRD